MISWGGVTISMRIVTIVTTYENVYFTYPPGYLGFKSIKDHWHFLIWVSIISRPLNKHFMHRNKLRQILGSCLIIVQCNRTKKIAYKHVYYTKYYKDTSWLCLWCTLNRVTAPRFHFGWHHRSVKVSRNCWKLGKPCWKKASLTFRSVLCHVWSGTLRCKMQANTRPICVPYIYNHTGPAPKGFVYISVKLKLRFCHIL